MAIASSALDRSHLHRRQSHDYHRHVEQGDLDGGFPILCLSGLTRNSNDFTEMVAALLETETGQVCHRDCRSIADDTLATAFPLPPSTHSRSHSPVCHTTGGAVHLHGLPRSGREPVDRRVNLQLGARGHRCVRAPDTPGARQRRHHRDLAGRPGRHAFAGHG